VTDPRFAGVTGRVADKLRVYVLGSGYGESVVVSFPDDVWLVMDCCTTGFGKDNLTEALLEHLKVARIDLLVLSHPDADHVIGMSDLVGNAARPVTRLWRYPGVVRDLIAKVTKRSSKPRFEALAAALTKIDTTIRRRQMEMDEVRTRAIWDLGPREYSVTALAPTPVDADRMEKQFEELMSYDDLLGDWEASDRIVEALAGGDWSDRPNVISLGVSVKWRDVRLVLAGDVENGIKNPGSGWKGVVACLGPLGTEPDRRDLLQGSSFVKVAHHGSSGAYWDAVWDLHATGGKVPIAAIAPFEASKLPTAAVLGSLRSKASLLALTSNAGDPVSRAKAGGWADVATAPLAATAPIVVLTFKSDALEMVERGTASGLLQ
jgi:hypothetical protein